MSRRPSLLGMTVTSVLKAKATVSNISTYSQFGLRSLLLIPIRTCSNMVLPLVDLGTTYRSAAVL